MLFQIRGNWVARHWKFVCIATGVTLLSSNCATFFITKHLYSWESTLPTDIFRIGGFKEVGPSINSTRVSFNCDQGPEVPDLPESLQGHVAMHVRHLNGTLVCGGEGSDRDNDPKHFGRKCYILKGGSDMWDPFAHDLVEQRVNAVIRISGSELQIIGGMTGDFQEPCHTSMEVLDLKDEKGWFKRDIVGKLKYECERRIQVVTIPCSGKSL